MDPKDIWKFLFSAFTTVLLIPLLDFFKVDNGIIIKPIEKVDVYTYKQLFYATENFHKPIKIGVIILDSSKLNFLENSSINVFAEDERKNLIRTSQIVSIPTTIMRGLTYLPKGKYSLVIKFNNIKISNGDNGFLNTYYVSNPKGDSDPELLKIVYAKWYHFYYFNPFIALILFFFTLLLFFVINKKRTHEKVNTPN